MRLRFFSILFAVSVWTLALMPPVWASDAIVLNTGVRDPFTTSANDGFVDRLVAEAFRRAGRKANVIVYQNSAKSLENANRGIDDGVALRIKGLEKKFPNLIRVPEKVMDNDFVAYAMSKPIETPDWSALAGYRIAYVNGWQIFQNNLKDHKQATKTKSAQQMFDLLSANKVDLMLYERWQGLWRAKQLGLRFIAGEPPLAKMEMFFYLNKKHESLVPEIAKALADMKRDGSYEEIFVQTLGKLQE